MLLTNRWDISYQYELNKVDDFWELELSGSLPWDLNSRPRNNKGTVSLAEVKPEDHILVLHFDDNCLGPSHLTSEEKAKWSDVFRGLSKANFKKTIFVCHGAPPRLDRFNPNKFFEKDLPLDEAVLSEIKEIVGDRTVVLPSEASKKAWGFTNTVVIEPAMEPIHFPFSSQRMNRGVIIHPAPTADPHGSGYHHSKVVSTQLPIDIYGVDSLNEFPSVLPPLLAFNEAESYERWYDGLDTVSQRNVCLDLQDGSVTSLSSLTAMMCGVPVVGNGVWNGDLIKHGITGYASVNLHEVRNYLVFLLKNPDISIRLGKQARSYISERRPFEQFVKKWRSLL